MSPPRAGAVAARLLAAPHLIHPDWLLAVSGPEQPAGAGPDGRASAPETVPRPVWAESRRGAGHDAARDAVPFAAAVPVAPALAGRLAAAARAFGERFVLGCPAAADRWGETAAWILADGARIHAAVHALGTADALVLFPDLSAALLTTSAGFAVAAGPRQFVEAVAGADVRRARTRFAGFALASTRVSAAPLEAARYYGCALSGRPWRPAWLAWTRAADVPYGGGIGAQLATMRQFAEGRLGAADFARMFRAARRQGMWAGERAADPLAAALEAACWALDSYVPTGERSPGAAGHLDLGGLRETVSAALRSA